MRDFHKAGFTMVELIMTILIMGILSAVVIPQFVDMSKDAKIAVTTEKLNALKAGIIGDGRMFANGKYTKQGYESHCVGLPTTLNDLVSQPGAGTCATVYNPFTKRGWRGPYVTTRDANFATDAWGTAIVYYTVGPPIRVLRSCGPDAVCGNADDISVKY